ncbi:RagB/SusD family nutrient uptake outer membrane protein [Galbibacter orientalis]|uniref:RagB/SusD family nutrient uptake outer membrane protein n=1 Tax=Galbibacter orientalis TaxID=453852 RepID=UPI003080268A
MKNTIYFLFLFFIISSCSKDENNQVPNTILKILVVDDKNNLISDAEVTTIPITTTVNTNIKGEAIINDIEPGDYTVKARLPEDIIDFRAKITVKEGIQNDVTIIVDPVDPILPVGIKVDEIIAEAYERLNDRYIFDASGYVSYWGEIGSDKVYCNQDKYTVFTELDAYYFDQNNNLINSVWEAHYNLIVRTINYGLKELKEIEKELSPTEQIQKAELMFLRGLLYFNMVKLYGNPIVVTEDDYESVSLPDKQGGEKAYDLIISDLQFAKDNLPTFTSSKRASKEAATALLGKVYLQSAGFPMQLEENYSKAIQQFEEVEGKFTLLQNYGALFKNDLKENSEIIFKVDFDSSKNVGGNYGVLWGALGYSKHDFFKLSTSTVNDYFDQSSPLEFPVSFPIETADKRFYQNIATFKVEGGDKINLEDKGEWRPYKYQKNIDTPVQEDNEDFDFILIRYADILLMKAEAINAISGPTSEALMLINEVRRRAYSNENHNISAGLSKSEFLQVILDERAKEFFMEGYRKDDLIRTKMLESAINSYNEQSENNPKKHYQSHKYIWPIPAREIDLNPNAKQNPGY